PPPSTLFPYTTLFRSPPPDPPTPPNPPPPPDPSSQPPCNPTGYGDYSATAGLGAFGGYVGPTVGVQTDNSTGDNYAYAGVSSGRSEEHTSELQSLRHL